MSNSPQIFHADWWVPAQVHPSNRGPFKMIQPGYEKRHTGSLVYYGDKDSTLELYLTPSHFRGTFFHHNPVMWGKDANGLLFTLFNVSIVADQETDFSTTRYIVDFILLGDQVLSLTEAKYNRCIVQFPYLRNWAFRNNLFSKTEENGCCHTLLDFPHQHILLEAQVEDGIKWVLRDKNRQDRSNYYDLIITQSTDFVIEADKATSIEVYYNNIVEFTQLLSIALYCEQSPTEIFFVSDKNIAFEFLFVKEDSVKPKSLKLIKYDELKEKIPSVLKIWHDNYDRVSPISTYLKESFREKNVFNAPDFLIVAEALDGYYKRFVNKKNGKDYRKYKDQIDILLKQFKDIEAIQRIKIDSKVLTDTRNKYSHLYPDEEKSGAVEGFDLIMLTKKCQILLTCCILNLLGLTNDEINLCINNSPLNETIESIESEFEL